MIFKCIGFLLVCIYLNPTLLEKQICMQKFEKTPLVYPQTWHVEYCNMFLLNYYKWFTIMYTLFSFRLELDEIIFGVVFDS